MEAKDILIIVITALAYGCACFLYLFFGEIATRLIGLSNPFIVTRLLWPLAVVLYNIFVFVDDVRYAASQRSIRDLEKFIERMNKAITDSGKGNGKSRARK